MIFYQLVFLYAMDISLLFCLHHSSDPSRLIPLTVYVSKNNGTDQETCGLKVLPCKTLQQGVSKLRWGGTLYVDGEGTRGSPYSCHESNKLFIKKSMMIQSYNQEPAFMSCNKGIVFESLGATNTGIAVRGVVFRGMTITLIDTSAVFSECMFMCSSQALIVKISRTVHSFELNITKSIFKENVDCIHINSGNSKYCNTVKMNLNDVTFQNNLISTCGLVSVLGSKVSVCTSYSVMMVLKNILAQNNLKIKGHNCTEISSTYPPIYDSFIMITAHKVIIDLINVTSNNNNNLRFLGLLAQKTNLKVHNSSYKNHNITKKGGVIFMAVSLMSLAISDSNFSNNWASSGAAISIQKSSKKRTLKLTLKLSGVAFGNSYGYQYGCVVSIEKAYSVQITVEKTQIVNCFNPNGQTGNWDYRTTGFCLHVIKDTCVKIENSTFINNLNGSSVLIEHESSEFGALEVAVRNSRFERNIGSPQRLIQDAPLTVVVIKPSKKQVMRKAGVNISDSRFINNRGGLLLQNVDATNIDNITCENNRDFCIQIIYDITIPQNALLLVANSIFTGNEVPIYIYNKNPEIVNILFKNLFLYENNCGKLISIYLGSSTFKAQIELDNVSFISNSLKNSGGYLLAVHASHHRNVAVKIRQSLIKDNYQNPGITHSIFSLLNFHMPEDVAMNSQICTKFPVYRYNNSIFFDDVTVKNNTASLSVVFLSNGKTRFAKCRFINNFSRHTLIGAHIYVVDQGTASLRIENSSFVQTYSKSKYSSHGEGLMQFVYEGAKGPLELINSTFESEVLTRTDSTLFTIQFGGYVFLDNNTKLFCPYGSTMKFENLSRLQQPNALAWSHCTSNITRFKFICKMCAQGTYSLQRGSFHGLTETLTKCLPCPFGANCSWQIKTTDDFWGYLISHQHFELKFTRCPQKYCKVPKHLSSYNGCYGNREGTMCGACRDGFTESMFDRKCRPVKDCNDRSFWVATAIFSIIMALYFIFRPNITNVLIQKLFWAKKRQVVPPNSRFNNSTSKEHKHGGGFSKIIFYFYQVNDLLRFSSYDYALHHSFFLAYVISFFNFEIEQFDKSSGCPFPGLNAVTKEFFLTLQVFAVMAIVCTIYIMYMLISFVTGRIRPYCASYIAAIIEILVLGYKRLAHTSLELLNCTPLTIDGSTQWRLFVDGNITCWVYWWQYALVVYNIVFVIPFLGILWLGTSKLRRQEINVFQFIMACFVPLPFLVYWLIKRCSRNDHQNGSAIGYENYRRQAAVEALLEVIEGPFRPPTRHSNGALYWESVLIGRRLILLFLVSFVNSPLLRLFIMTIVCVLTLVHNLLVMPYKEKKANYLALVLLFIHVFIATTNLCKSVFIADGVFPKGPTKALIDTLVTVNYVVLEIIPGAWAILVVMAVLSQIAQFMVILLKAMCACVCRNNSTNPRNDQLQFIQETEIHQPFLES